MNAEIAILYAATFSVAAFHTMSPDHWLPFVMLGRSQRWSKLKTELVALVAGVGHVGTSIAIALVGILLGAEISEHFASVAEITTGAALIVFGFAYALYAWRTGGHVHLIGGHTHEHAGHEHDHHDHDHAHEHHAHDHGFVLAAATESPVAAQISSVEEHWGHDHGERDHHDHSHDDDHEHHAHDHGEHHHDHHEHTHPHADDFAAGSGAGVSRTGRAAYGPVIIMGLTPCVALLPLAFAAAGFGLPTTLSVIALFAVATIVPILVLTFLGSVGLGMLKFGWVERYSDVVTGIVIGCIGLMTVFLGL